MWQAPRAPVDETSQMSDATKASFYHLKTADAQWKAEDVDAAVMTLDRVAGAGGPSAPLAYLAAARIRTDYDNLRGAVRTYEAMLRALPDYRVSEQTCDVNSVFRNQVRLQRRPINRDATGGRAAAAAGSGHAGTENRGHDASRRRTRGECRPAR